MFNRKFELRAAKAADFCNDKYHVSDWACAHARYIIKDVENGKEWFLSYFWRKDLKEIFEIINKKWG